MFLDEPTTGTKIHLPRHLQDNRPPDLIFSSRGFSNTGLDSSVSLDVMTAIRSLADQDRTILCTIHQARYFSSVEVEEERFR